MPRTGRCIIEAGGPDRASVMHEDVIDSLDVFSVVPVRFPLTETEGGDVAGYMEVVPTDAVVVSGPAAKAVSYQELSMAPGEGGWRWRVALRQVSGRPRNHRPRPAALVHTDPGARPVLGLRPPRPPEPPGRTDRGPGRGRRDRDRLDHRGRGSPPRERHRPPSLERRTSGSAPSLRCSSTSSTVCIERREWATSA